MKKNCLFVLLIFICLFGFCNRVEAKTYDLPYGKETAGAAATYVDEFCQGINGSKFKCSVYCKGKEFPACSLGRDQTIASCSDDCGRKEKVTVKIKIDDFGDFMSVIDTGNDVSSTSNQSYRNLEAYCELYKNNELCKDFKKAQDNGTEDDGLKQCYATLSWKGDENHPSVSHPKLLILYNPKDDSVALRPGSGTGDIVDYTDSFISNGHTYHFYSYMDKDDVSSGYKKFLDSLAPKIKSNSSGVCNGIFNFCPLNQDGFNQWYAEIDTSKKCDEISSDYASITQSVGGSSSGEIDIQLSGTETSHAPGLIQEKVTIKTCSDLFKGDGDNTILLDILKILVGTVKVLVPVILLVLGSIDFAKAIIAQDENGIKKAQSKFIKRLIIAVAIFLIPTIIKTLLDIAHSVWPDIISSSEDVFCGIL